MDHVAAPEADVFLKDGDSHKSMDLHDSKHVIDFIQNEVQSYDNVFVAKNKSEELNGDHSNIEAKELTNGSNESSLPLTPLQDDDDVLELPKVPSDIPSSTPADVFGKSNSDLLLDTNTSPIVSFDLLDIEKPKDDLVEEPNLVDHDIAEPVDSAQFQHLEKIVDHTAEPSVPFLVPESCDLLSNQHKEAKSSPVELAVTPEAEPPKSESKVEKEIAKATVSEKPAEKPKVNASEKSEIGAKDFFTKYGLDTWFNPERLDPTVEAYIYWRDPKLSGIIFGSGLVLLLSLAYFSLISVVANTGLAVLTCAIVFRIYKDIMQAVQKTPQTHPYSVFLNRDIALPQEKVPELVDALILHINACLGELRRLFLVEDMIESLKFALVLWILTYVGSWFNGLTLVIIGFVALFTLPKVYENNKVQIDQNLALVRAKVEELANKIKEALPAPLRRKVPEKKE